MEQKKSNLVWLAVVVALALLVWWYWGYQSAPETDALSGGDTTADIGQDLQSVDLGAVEQELDALDKDINQL